jgi:hypothetical protein
MTSAISTTTAVVAVTPITATGGLLRSVGCRVRGGDRGGVVRDGTGRGAIDVVRVVAVVSLVGSVVGDVALLRFGASHLR